MDVVTEVKRAGGVATIFLKSGEVIQAPSALFLERRVRPGQELDAENYRAFIREKGYPHALKAAVDYLALRERSEKEILQRLKRVHYHETTIARVMETLQGHHLYSDARFAETWVAHRARKYGKRRIAMELQHKGISGQTAQQALDGLDSREEKAAAVKQAGKLARRMKGDSQKMMQALVRRGYDWQTARAAVQQVMDAIDTEEER